MPNISTSDMSLAFRNDVLHLIILPTEQCNFRCTYCYEDFRVGKMERAVITGIKNLLAARAAELRRLHIAWFGGEPLIALGVIEEIAGFARELAERHTELTCTGEMTTNAYLLDRGTAERLDSLGVRNYQITLDGPEEHHDRTRLRRDGRGSFERIWANLLGLRAGNPRLRIALRVHVTPDNLAVMPAFLRLLRQEFLGDPRFTLLLRAVGRWGGPNDAHMRVLEGAEKRRAMSMLRQEALAGLEEESTHTTGNVCYASRPNSLIIRATGDIGKCTVALSDPANNIGRIREDGSLALRNEDLAPWLRGWRNADTDALGCPLIGIPRKAKEPVLLQIGARPLQAKKTDAQTGG